MNFRQLLNLPSGIIDIQWADPSTLFFLQQTPDGRVLGTINLTMDLAVQDLPFNFPREFAVHQNTQQIAILCERELIIAVGFPNPRVLFKQRLNGLRNELGGNLQWSGNGEYVAVVDRRFDARAMNYLFNDLHVIQISNGQLWTITSTQNIVNVSLSEIGQVSFEETGLQQVQVRTPFGSHIGSYAEVHSNQSQNIYGPKLGQAAWLAWSTNTANLMAKPYESNSIWHLCTYHLDQGDRPPSYIGWSPDGRRVFQNPMLGGKPRWLMHQFKHDDLQHLVVGTMMPMPSSRISCSPDSWHAACITSVGPAIITFDSR